MTRFDYTTIATLFLLLLDVFLLQGTTRLIVGFSIAGIYGAILNVAMFMPTWKFYCPIHTRSGTKRRQVALTFDDGPDPEATPPLLELLKERNIPATFFLIGKRVDEHPQLAQRITEDGHLIANHSYQHSYLMNFFPPARLRRELQDAQRSIKAATDLVPRFYRTPLGLTNPAFTMDIKPLDLEFVGWIIRALDRKGTPEKVVDRILAGTMPGGILILHDGWTRPDRLLDIVRRLLDGLEEMGYEVVPLDRLIESEPYQFRNKR